jgi:hypothetical protein
MDYQGNSHNKTEKKIIKEEKKVEKVISGEVVTRKKPLGRRFKEIFFGGDFKVAARHVAADVLLPSLRNLIMDASTEGIKRVIYGESGVSRRRGVEYRPLVQYDNPIKRLGRDPRERSYLPDQPPLSAKTRSRREINEIILVSRQEAELVLERLTDIIDMYEVASVADLHDLLGIQATHVDNKWGWTFLNNVEIRQIRDGYLLDLPYPEAI